MRKRGRKGRRERGVDGIKEEEREKENIQTKYLTL